MSLYIFRIQIHQGPVIYPSRNKLFRRPAAELHRYAAHWRRAGINRRDITALNTPVEVPQGILRKFMAIEELTKRHI